MSGSAAVRSGAPVGAITDAQQEPISPDVARAQAFLGQPSLFGGLLGIGGPNDDAIKQTLAQLKIDPRGLTAKAGTPEYMEQLGKLLKPYEQQLQAQLKMPGKSLGEMRAALSQQLAGQNTQDERGILGTSPFDTQSLPQLVEQLTKGPQTPSDPQQRTPGGPQDRMDPQGQPEAPALPQPPQTRPRPEQRNAVNAGVTTPRTQKRMVRGDEPAAEEIDTPEVRAKTEPDAAVLRANDKPDPARDDGVVATAPTQARITSVAPNQATGTRPDFGDVAPRTTLLTTLTDPKDFNASVSDLWAAKDFKPPPKGAPPPTQQQLDADPHLKAWFTIRGSASNQLDNLWQYNDESKAFYKRMFTPPADTAK